MMNEELIIELEKLTGQLPVDNRHPIQKALDGPLWKGLSEADNCLKIISETQDFSIFNEHMQYFGNSGAPVSYENLLSWLVERTKVTGSKGALNEIYEYVTNPEIQVQHIELLIGVYADVEFEFSNGVKFTSPGNIANKTLGNNLLNEGFRKQVPYPEVTAILSANFDHPVIHEKESSDSKPFNKIQIPHDQLKTTRLILSLSRPVNWGVHSIASTTVAPDHFPILTQGQA